MALLRCKSCGKSTMYNITITDRADRELSDILEYLSSASESNSGDRIC